MIYTQRIYYALAFIVISLGLLRWKPKLKWPVMMVYAVAVVYLTFLMRHPYRSARYLLDPFHAWRYVIRVTEKGIVLGSRSQLKVSSEYPSVCSVWVSASYDLETGGPLVEGPALRVRGFPDD